MWTRDSRTFTVCLELQTVLCTCGMCDYQSNLPWLSPARVQLAARRRYSLYSYVQAYGLDCKPKSAKPCRGALLKSAEQRRQFGWGRSKSFACFRCTGHTPMMHSLLLWVPSRIANGPKLTCPTNWIAKVAWGSWGCHHTLCDFNCAFATVMSVQLQSIENWQYPSLSV